MLKTGLTAFALGCGLVVAGAPAPAQAADYTVLYRFQYGTDGGNPVGGLTEVGGTLYGTTQDGGVSNNGTVFSLSLATGAETVLYSFQGGGDGAVPRAGLVDADGVLYGTTEIGGGIKNKTCKSGCGTVFSLDPSTGAYKLLHVFAGHGGRGYPQADLVKVGGRLFGTAYGLYSDGAVFSIDPVSGALRAEHSFLGGSDGKNPYASLIEIGGLLYGTTSGGGSAGVGTVFSLDPKTRATRIVYSFQNGNDGSLPASSLIEIGGLLYGTTLYGGSPANHGTVFSLDPSTGVEQVLHAFKGSKDGFTPYGALIDLGGILYGTVSGGTASGHGAVFSLNLKTGNERIVYAFQGGSDGAEPGGDLVAIGGTLYGTTFLGGNTSNGTSYGTVFALTP